MCLKVCACVRVSVCMCACMRLCVCAVLLLCFVFAAADLMMFFERVFAFV